MLNVSNIATRDDLTVLFDNITIDDDDFTITLTHIDRNYLPISEFDGILDDIEEFSKLNNYILEIDYNNVLHLSLFKLTKEY